MLYNKTITIDVFDTILSSVGLFEDREILRSTYVPDELPHREKEIKNLATILAPALRTETPSNILIFGKPGTGKTAATKFTTNALKIKGKEINKQIHPIHINCEFVRTQYRIIQTIAHYFIDKDSDHIPFTGLPKDEIYSRMLSLIDSKSCVVIVILDEIDKLKDDTTLYMLTRINTDLKTSKVSVIGISNNLRYTDFLDARVKSSLGEETMIFNPYNANQLQDILTARAKLALRSGTIEGDVIPLCAALSAQEHGDARKALDLLRMSAELAERNKDERITNAHVKLAQSNLEINHLSRVIHNLPDQSKLILHAITVAQKQNKKAGMYSASTTGEIYNIYQELSKRTHYNVLTQRSITGLVSELDSLGIITARVISKGRHGRTREIQIPAPNQLMEILYEDDLIKEVIDYKFKSQTRLI